MASQELIAYTGIAAGLVGTLTGVISLVISYKAYKAVSENKLFDMKLQCRKDLVDLDELIQSFNTVFEQVIITRPRVLVAKTGSRRSGNKAIWDKKVSDAKSEFNALVERKNTIPHKIEHTAPERLEHLITNIHELTVKVQSLLNEFEREMRSDEEFTEAKESACAK